MYELHHFDRVLRCNSTIVYSYLLEYPIIRLVHIFIKLEIREIYFKVSSKGRNTFFNLR